MSRQTFIKEIRIKFKWHSDANYAALDVVESESGIVGYIITTSENGEFYQTGAHKDLDTALKIYASEEKALLERIAPDGDAKNQIKLF